MTNKEKTEWPDAHIVRYANKLLDDYVTPEGTIRMRDLRKCVERAFKKHQPKKGKE